MKKTKNKEFNDREKDAKEGFYVGGVMNILEALYCNKKFKRPRRKKALPVFTEEEVGLLATYLFFKPKNWRMVKFKLDNFPQFAKMKLRRFKKE